LTGSIIDCRFSHFFVARAGGRPPEGTWLVVGRLATAYYFINFLLILPTIGKPERPGPLPTSIVQTALHAARANKNSGIVWSEASLTEYIVDPSGKMPGTKMMFSDKNEQEIRDLWAYLKQFGSDGKKK